MGQAILRSVVHALNHLGVEDKRLVHTPADLVGANKIILPGVGAFGAGMKQLHKQDLVIPLTEALLAGTPYLGICLGMQFLFERSDEMGDHEGLGLLSGQVTRFAPNPGLKVPHMGWNQLQQKQSSPLLKDIGRDSSAYFVHSYYCGPTDPANIVATVEYGKPFTAVVQRENIFGVQFHPEKSQRTGLQLLKNFLEM